MMVQFFEPMLSGAFFIFKKILIYVLSVGAWPNSVLRNLQAALYMQSHHLLCLNLTTSCFFNSGPVSLSPVICRYGFESVEPLWFRLCGHALVPLVRTHFGSVQLWCGSGLVTLILFFLFYSQTI